ncbi:hypothetical protein HDU87_001411 [Geranomyces variabilis]|uniref:Spindle pole body component n=1 Tax=Geranomyces variabilis TaxID=109894 RepID=A0AAD5XSR2_9FUNG|nr:hypothetical protein HDU87_001411 [Geranomyces variabilis]
MTWNNKTRARRSQPETARQAEIKGLVSNLLQHLTSADHAPPSAKDLDVAYRQVMNHNYQTTNEHDVQRRLYGLVEKFEMHGQTDVAGALSDRLDRLAKLSAISVVYDVLHILLETSVSPTHHHYEQNVETRHTHEPDLTWSEILAEDPLDGQHWVEDETEDPGLESDAESDDSEADEAPRYDGPAEVGSLHQGPRSLSKAAAGLREAAQETSAFLNAQYWNYERKDVLEEDISFRPDDPNTLVPALVAHRKFSPSFSYLTLAGDAYIREANLVRECLYVLAASRRGSSSPAFDVSEDGLVTVKKVQFTLTHVTQPTMWAMLSWFAEGATAVHRVRRFVDTVSAEQARRTLTEQALANGLLGPIADLDIEIAKLEEWHQPYLREMNKSGEQDLGTLTALRVSIAPLISTFSDLGMLIPESTPLRTSPAHTAASLLTRVHAAVATCDATCLRPERAAVLLDVALSAMEPHLRMVHTWISDGELEDPRDEFFVVSGTTNSSCEEWERGFVIRQSEARTGSAQVVPCVFHDVKDAILACGKSLKMIEHIDQAQAMRLRSGSRIPLHETLASAVRSELYASADTAAQVKPYIGESDSSAPNPPVAVAAGLSGGGDVTRLFPTACAAFLNTGAPTGTTLPAKRVAPAKPAVAVRPALTVLGDVLTRIVNARRDVVAERLTELLFTQCQMQQHFAALQAVFLMTNGGVMHPFCEELFAMARTGRLASRPHALNAAYADCVAANAAIPQPGWSRLDASRFTFSVPPLRKPTTSTTSLCDITATISIAYDVPPLLMSIITRANIATYQDVARVLLRLKFVEAELVREGCGGGTGGRRGSAPRGAAREARLRAALRIRLMHFVASLRGFFMGAVIHAECAVFAERLETAKGMGELIALHDAFVSAVRDRCLLSEKARVLWTRMAEVLEVAVRFAALCRARDDGEDLHDGRAASPDDSADHQRLIADAHAFEDALRKLQREAEDEVALVQKDLDDLARHGVQHLEALAAALAW